MTKAKKWLTAAAVFFAAGIAAGSLAAIKTSPDTLYGYFQGLAAGGISTRTGTAVCDALILWAVLFFSAFFRFGAVTAAAAVGAKGFTDGYAVAAIMRILGIKGIGLCFFDILGAPLALLMAALAMCRLTDEKSSAAPYLAGGGILLVMMCLAAALGSVAALAVSKSVLSALSL